MENYAGEIDLSKRRLEREQRATPQFRQYRGFYRTRLTLRCVSFVFCLAIIVALCDDLRWYLNTKKLSTPYKDGSGSFPVWPQNVKLWPTYVLLGAACVAAFINLLLIVASIHKNIRRMTNVGNLTTIVVSSACLAIWIGVTAWYGTWDSKNTNWDLMSWSCTHQGPKFDYEEIDFEDFCTEFRFAFWAGVGLAIMEALNLIIFVVWWLKARHSQGYHAVEDV